MAASEVETWPCPALLTESSRSEDETARADIWPEAASRFGTRIIAVGVSAPALCGENRTTRRLAGWIRHIDRNGKVDSLLWAGRVTVSARLTWSPLLSGADSSVQHGQG